MTFPLDITKTRLQIQGERASTVSSTTATNVPYRGMVRTAVGIGEYTEATARGRNNISKNYTRIISGMDIFQSYPLNVKITQCLRKADWMNIA